MSLTGETKNTTGLSNNFSVKVWPSFEMSYLTCPETTEGVDLT